MIKGIIELDDNDNFDLEISKHDLTLVAFTAPWCEDLYPEYVILADLFPNSIYRVDVDSSSSLKERFAIISLPTMKWFKHGIFVGDYIWQKNDNMELVFNAKKKKQSIYY